MKSDLEQRPKNDLWYMYISMYSFSLIHCTYTNFYTIYINSFWVIHKSIKNYIWSWPSCKKVKGQPTVIIWANLVVLECLMLYTKFQRHWPIGSEEDFLKVFTIYEHRCHLGHVTTILSANFLSAIPRRHHVKFDFGLAQQFLRRVRTTATEACLYYKLMDEPSAQAS